jgi:hypothetical protein
VDNLFNKYFGDVREDDFYGGPVRGYDDQGFPFVGQHPGLLTRDELAEAPVVNDFRCGWFRLWDDADHKAFVQLMDHVYNNKCFLHRRQDVLVPDSPDGAPGGNLKVYLEWTQPRAVPPPRGPGAA